MKFILAGGCACAAVVAGCATQVAKPVAVPVLSSEPVGIERETPLATVGQVMSRTNAKREHTLLLQAGETAEYRVKVDAEGTYRLRVRYSNDDPGKCDDVVVKVDGRHMKPFHSQNTRTGGMQPGDGWNAFVESPDVPLGLLTAGEHTIAVLIDDADAFGIELDRLTIERLEDTVSR